MRKKQTVPLWQWGLLLLIAGLIANLAVGMLLPKLAPAPAGSDAAWGQAFGRGLVTVLAVLAGLVLIVLHFVRRKRD
jgi:polyferredoxin